MPDPAANLAALQSLKQSPAWSLILAALTKQMNRALVPAIRSGTVDEIAIAAISRAASYEALGWVRDRMLSELIERERKAAQE